MQKVVAQAGRHSIRDVEGYMVLAMAHHQLKQTVEARAALASGVALAEAKLPRLENGDLGELWIDWLIGQALMKEAQALLGGTQPKL